MDLLRDRGQHLVADRVAVGVVHALEVVDVEHQHRQRLLEAVGCCPGLGERAHAGAAVGQAGEQVGHRRVFEAAIADRQLGGELLQLGPVALPGLQQLHVMPGGAQAGTQRAHVDRLGQEVIHAGLEGLGDFFFGVEAGEHDQVDRLPPLGGAQRARELEAAEPGHQPVGDDDLGLGLDGERERLGAGAGTHHRMAERVAQHGFHDGARGGIVVDQQHAQRTGAAAVLGAQRVRGGHLCERGQRRGRHAQQFAPGAPAPHQLVDGGAELVGVEADLAAEQQQLGRAAVVLGVGRQAEVGNAARQIEQVHQLVRA